MAIVILFLIAFASAGLLLARMFTQNNFDETCLQYLWVLIASIGLGGLIEVIDGLDELLTARLKRILELLEKK